MDQNEELDKIEAETAEKLKTKNRFQDLSEKVITTAKEKDEVEAKYKAETDARTKAEKERDFYKDFSKLSAKYPQATDHQDKILEKVNAGYSTKDATIAVLDDVGMLQPITNSTQSMRPTNVAGGSASTSMSDYGDKNPQDMSQEDRRNALMQAEKEGINIFKIT